MRIHRTVVITFSSFVMGVGLGYWALPVDAEVDSSAIHQPHRRTIRGTQARANTSPHRPTRSSRHRDSTPSIKTDRSGNLLLPASMADRIQCMLLNGTKANRSDLRLIGLSDGQIDQVQQIMEETIQRCFDRERSVMIEFTTSDDELVKLIPGNPAAAAAEKQWLIDAVRLAGATNAELLEKRLIEEIGYITMGFGATDSYFRVSRVEDGSENSENRLSFERIQLYLQPGETSPAPGSSFMDYQKSYKFHSSNRFGGKNPPDYTLHLLQDGQWKHLLETRITSE
ncbi:MAG TPA: hypothetical protein VLO11_14210 [Luteolibacter sp.]|nr:hypothetical protein [Luteolibacter sp.]